MQPESVSRRVRDAVERVRRLNGGKVSVVVGYSVSEFEIVEVDHPDDDSPATRDLLTVGVGGQAVVIGYEVYQEIQREAMAGLRGFYSIGPNGEELFVFDPILRPF